MKKLLSVVLSTILVLALAVPSLADDADLRDAVTTGKALALVPVEMVSPGEGWLLVSLSPDGNTSVWKNSDAAKIALVRNGEVIEVHAAPERGAGDPYGTLEDQLFWLSGCIPGADGLSWSPDGRYAILSCKQELIKTTGHLDLVMLDAENGEAFLAAAYFSSVPFQIRDMWDERYGSVYEARFDSTGRYIWFVGFVNSLTESIGLFRVDTKTGTTDLMAKGFRFSNINKTLFDTGSGSLLIAAGSSDKNQSEDDYFLFTPEETPMPGGNTVVLAERPYSNTYIRGNAYLSAKTGKGIIFNICPTLTSLKANAKSAKAASRIAIIANSLNRITPDGIDLSRYWRLAGDPSDFASLHLEEIDPGIIAILSKTLSGGKGTDTEEEALDAYAAKNEESTAPRISCACLSPDGQFALLCAWNTTEAYYLLMDLDTMDLFPVNGPENLREVIYGSGWSQLFYPGMQWNEDGTLLILNGKTVEAYRIARIEVTDNP